MYPYACVALCAACEAALHHSRLSRLSSRPSMHARAAAAQSLSKACLGAVAVQRQGVEGEVALAACQRLQQSTVHSALQAVYYASGSMNSAEMHWPRCAGPPVTGRALRQQCGGTSCLRAAGLPRFTRVATLLLHLGDWRCGHAKHLAIRARQLSSLQGQNNSRSMSAGITVCRSRHRTHSKHALQVHSSRLVRMQRMVDLAHEPRTLTHASAPHSTPSSRLVSWHCNLKERGSVLLPCSRQLRCLRLHARVQNARRRQLLQHRWRRAAGTAPRNLPDPTLCRQTTSALRLNFNAGRLAPKYTPAACAARSACTVDAQYYQQTPPIELGLPTHLNCAQGGRHQGHVHIKGNGRHCQPGIRVAPVAAGTAAGAGAGA